MRRARSLPRCRGSGHWGTQLANHAQISKSLANRPTAFRHAGVRGRVMCCRADTFHEFFGIEKWRKKAPSFTLRGDCHKLFLEINKVESRDLLSSTTVPSQIVKSQDEFQNCRRSTNAQGGVQLANLFHRSYDKFRLRIIRL